VNGRVLGSIFLWSFLSFCLPHEAPGQVNITTLSTGGGSSRVVAQTNLFLPSGLTQPALDFSFGFATDEVAAPELFLDSFSLTILRTNDNAGAVFFTLDAGGLVLAPETPGGIFIDPSGLQVTPITYPTLQPVLLNQAAFHFIAEVPAELVGSNAQLIFSLFDNQDATASQAWFGQVSLIPEPGVAALLLLGAAATPLNTRFRKSNQKTKLASYNT
jgi:hypothetical protein